MADSVNVEARKRDATTLQAANEVLSGQSKKGRFAKLLPFLGPAFIASVAYMDPGNFATNIAGGAQFGYMLLWVIVASNLMAMLLQTLSAKLGIATGRSLPEVCRDHYPRWAAVGLWITAELAAIMTDRGSAAGRSGLGAVMGSKKLKAIAVRGSRRCPWADPPALVAYAKQLSVSLQRMKFLRGSCCW